MTSTQFHAQETERRLDKILGYFDDLGLTDALPDVRAALARARSIEIPSDPDRSVRAVVIDMAERVAAGKVKLPAAGQAVTDAGDRIDAKTAEVEVLRHARLSAMVTAWRTLEAHGDRLIVDILRPYWARIAADAATAYEALPPLIRTDEDAIADPDALEPWAALTEARRRKIVLSKLVTELRVRDVVPGSDDIHPAELWWRHPEHVPTERTHDIPGPVLLAAAVAMGAGPFLWTVDEYLEAHRPPPARVIPGFTGGDAA